MKCFNPSEVIDFGGRLESAKAAAGDACYSGLSVAMENSPTILSCRF